MRNGEERIKEWIKIARIDWKRAIKNLTANDVNVPGPHHVI